MANTSIDVTKYKVLLMDDSEDLVEVTTRLLKILGFEVQSCNSGQSCIEIAQISNPDIILLDIEMPGMDGFTTCAYIRKQAWGHGLPIVALTAYNKDDFDQRSKDAGFNGHLAKPVEWQQLSAFIINTITSSKSS